MGEDRVRTETAADEEFDRLWRAKFGELPARVAPADIVETVDADPAHQEPNEPTVRREWG